MVLFFSFFCHGTHQFLVIGDENRVMNDGKQQIQTVPNNLVLLKYFGLFFIWLLAHTIIDP